MGTRGSKSVCPPHFSFVTDLLLCTKCCSLSLAQYQHFNMPEMTETLTTKPEEESNENDSGTDSDGDDDSIPELEETAGETAGDAAVSAAAAAGLGEDATSKAKQSRGEKKARKIMSKPEASDRSLQGYHQEVQEHLVCDQQARCIQE